MSEYPVQKLVGGLHRQKSYRQTRVPATSSCVALSLRGPIQALEIRPTVGR